MKLCEREGCGKPARRKKEWGRFCSDACRAADHRQRNGYASLEQIKALQQANVRKTEPVKKRQPRTPRRSDVKISYDNVVEAYAKLIGPQTARRVADRLVTDRQRQLLDELG